MRCIFVQEVTWQEPCWEVKGRCTGRRKRRLRSFLLCFGGWLGGGAILQGMFGLGNLPQREPVRLWGMVKLVKWISWEFEERAWLLVVVGWLVVNGWCVVPREKLRPPHHWSWSEQENIGERLTCWAFCWSCGTRCSKCGCSCWLWWGSHHIHWCHFSGCLTCHS